MEMDWIGYGTMFPLLNLNKKSPSISEEAGGGLITLPGPPLSFDRRKKLYFCGGGFCPVGLYILPPPSLWLFTLDAFLIYMIFQIICSYKYKALNNTSQVNYLLSLTFLNES
jgi:hypothetical protein